MDEDSIEFDILDDVADYERIPPQLWYKVQVIAAVEGDGDLRPLKVLEGETAMTSWVVSFCFRLGS
jgi:hypothetical protein